MNIFSQFGLALVCGLVIAINQGQAWEPLLCDYGIGTALHPIQKPANAPEVGSGADHVYIFAINGLDPLCIGNFNGLCACLKEHGYANTFFAQLYTGTETADRIRAIRAFDSRARIVLMGYSLGCNRVRSVAHRLAENGIQVDLLIYMFGDTLFDSPRNSPDNVCRILNLGCHGMLLTGGDLFMNGPTLPGARNCRINALHLCGPSRLETVSLILEELSTLSSAPARPTAPLPQNNGAVGVAQK
jgi:hypothetical protein